MKSRNLLNEAIEVKRVEDNRIDEVIAEMLKIEATALGIQNDTKREIEEYENRHEQRIKEFDESLSIEASKKLEILKEQLKADKERELFAMRDEILQYTAKLDKLYEANHEKWVKDIVDSIIKE